jgi:hypothetical protein
VLLLDVLFLAVLASWRSEDGGGEQAPEASAVHLPRYTETEVKDFH